MRKLITIVLVSFGLVVAAETPKDTKDTKNSGDPIKPQ